MNTPTANSAMLGPLRARWQALSDRERLGLKLASGALALLLLWSLAIRPAWVRWSEARARLPQAMAQWNQMQQMAAQATAWKTGIAPGGVAVTGPTVPDMALREALVQALGPDASLEVEASELVLRFAQASPEGLRAALGLARSRLQATVVQAELLPSESGLKGQLRLQWPRP